MTASTLTRIIRATVPCPAALLAGLGLPASAATQTPAEKVTFADHVLPVFRNACNNCHNPDKKKAGLDLTTYQAAMAGSDNGPMAASGDPAGSMLFKVMTHAAEPTMPPKRDKLPQAELEVVHKWIAGGLLENAGGAAVAGAKPKVDLSAVASVGRPTGAIAIPTGLSAEPLVRTARPGAVEALASSPWAPVVAVGGQRQIVLYHAGSLEVLGVLPFDEGVPRVLRFSRSGGLLLAAGGTGAKVGKVVLYDVATGDRVAAVGDEQDEVLAADITPDHKIVALGSTNRLVKGYDVADGKELYSIKKHTDWVTAIAISPSGEYLATADRAGNLHVWEAKTGGELHNLVGHKDSVDALAFRGDSSVLLSGSKDGTAKLWDVAEGKQLKTWNGHAGGVSSGNFTHDGRIVTTGRDKQVKVWTAAGDGGKPLAPNFDDVALHATFDSEGKRVFAGDWAGTIRVWDVADGKAVGELSPNPPRIADRLAAAAKRLADAEPAVGKAEAEFKVLQAAAEKAGDEHKTVLATIESAGKQVAESEAAGKAAGGMLPAARQSAAKAAEQAAVKRRLTEKWSAALAEAEKVARAAADNTAKAAANQLAANVSKAERASGEATAALAAVEKAIANDPDDAEAKAAVIGATGRVERRTRQVDDARRALAEAKAPKTDAEPAKPTSAVAKAKAELEQARTDAAAAKQSADEAGRAVEKAEAEGRAAAAALAAAKNQAAAAEKQAKAAADAAKVAAEKVAPARKAFADAKGALDATRFAVAKLRSAQALTSFNTAKKLLSAKAAEKAAAEQAAKDAVAAVERAKGDIAAFEKARQESPEKVKQLAAQVPALRKSLADAAATAEASARDVAEREALAVQAAELARRVADQAQKTKDSKLMADAESAATKLVEGLAGDLTQAKEKAGTSAQARAKAEAELAANEQAAAKEKSDAENAAKIVAGLAKALADAEADVPRKQALAQDAEKPIGEVKAKVEQARSEHDKLVLEAAAVDPAKRG